VKKILIYLPIIIWIGLGLFEIVSFFVWNPKPMYFRAWEYAVNTDGKDGYYVPFKPLITYNGPMSGDLLAMTNFKPKSSEIRHQDFYIDEYGFRNRKGLLDKPVDVVLMGTSFVGGAQLTQKDLISEMLIDKYNIRTYNYATLPLQHFWEDTRFIKNPPKFAVVIMNEAEALQNTWVEVLTDSTASHEVKKWNSHEEWAKQNDPVDLSYEGITKIVYRFSMVRYLAKTAYRDIVNAIYPRAKVAGAFTTSETYDPKQDIIFYDINSYDPRLSSTFGQAIPATVKTLEKTRDVLKERNIKLIVGVVPSKASLYSTRYRSLPESQRSIFKLEEEMKNHDITYLPIAQPILDYSRTHNDLLYYPDDSHWRPQINYIIVPILARTIQEESTTDSTNPSPDN
jgi:hypothetical protein